MCVRSPLCRCPLPAIPPPPAQPVLACLQGCRDVDVVAAFADSIWTGDGDDLEGQSSLGRLRVSASPELLGAGRYCILLGGGFGPNWAVEAAVGSSIAAAAYGMGVDADAAVSEVVMARRSTVLQLLLALQVAPPLLPHPPVSR